MLLIATLLASSIVSLEARVAYTSSVSTKGRGKVESLRTSTVTSISPATSRREPIISPSRIEECISPMASSAPSTFTGNYNVAPSVNKVVPNLPPLSSRVPVSPLSLLVPSQLLQPFLLKEYRTLYRVFLLFGLHR